MKNKEVRGILALVVVTALSFGVIAGSRALSKDAAGAADTGAAEGAVVEEYDVSAAEQIESAARTADGYTVTVREKGYANDIVVKVNFAEDAKTIRTVEVLEQNETESLGAKIAEPEFLGQFEGAEAPVYLPGMEVPAAGTETSDAADTEAEDREEQLKELESAQLQDGTYEARGEADSNGFTDVVTLTVAGGKITAVSWDAVMPDGQTKSVMSENGEYTMTETGLTWAAQSEALANAVLENGSLSFLKPDGEGKTDAVSGVSISVNGFVSLAQQCLEQAAGVSEAPLELQDGTYEAKGEADSNGFADVVSITVAEGKITEASWDAVTEDGTKKSVMSENGEYTMTETGLTWAAQSEALAKALIENQSLTFLKPDAEGKTDAVSGVSISVNGFVSLAQQCLEQAAGIETAQSETAESDAQKESQSGSEEGTLVDAVSGATKSSTAAVTAINDAYNFLATVK